VNYSQFAPLFFKQGEKKMVDPANFWEFAQKVFNDDLDSDKKNVFKTRKANTNKSLEEKIYDFILVAKAQGKKEFVEIGSINTNFQNTLKRALKLEGLPTDATLLNLCEKLKNNGQPVVDELRLKQLEVQEKADMFVHQAKKLHVDMELKLDELYPPQRNGPKKTPAEKVVPAGPTAIDLIAQEAAKVKEELAKVQQKAEQERRELEDNLFLLYQIS